MNLISAIQKIQFLDYLIGLEKTGSPPELAKKLNISERTLYNYLTDLKSLGTPISFSRTKQSYIYVKSGRFRLGFSSERPHELSDNLNPGKSKHNFPGRQDSIH